MGIQELYQYYWYEKADPRSRDFFLINTPWLIPSITFAYLYYVLRCGPRYMKDRPAYSLTTFVKCYNLLQVVANALLVYHILNAGWLTELTIFCIPYTYNYEPNRLKLVRMVWWAFVWRLADYTETVVFVLRKKNNQITFLHIYHHISIILMGWAFVRYVPAEPVTFFIMVNCTVHVIMYTYYFLSTFEGQIQKYLRKVKPFITIIQMAQFVLLMVYNAQGLSPSCGFPVFAAVVSLLNLSMNFVLFYNFYKKTYTKKSKKA